MIPKKDKKKKGFQNIIFPVALGVLTVGAAAFLIVSNWKISQKREDLASKIEFLKEEIRQAEEKKAELEQGINQSQSQEYLEEVARDDLGLKKPGEEVFVVQSFETTTVESVPGSKSFWQKIWEKLNLRD